MSGYKNAVIFDAPISFHTFDFDSNEYSNGNINDEIGSNEHPMTMFGVNYELEYFSLNPIEISNQYSMLLARNDKYDGIWSNVYGYVLHNHEYNMEQWSVEFIIDKAYAGSIRNYGEPGYYQNIYTPLVKKGTAINIYMLDSYYNSSTQDGIYAKILGDTRSVSHIHSTRHPIFATPSHVVVTYKTEQIDTNLYSSTLSLYVNGRLASQNYQEYEDNPPYMIDASTWYICGKGGLYTNPVTDYPTEFTAFDQLALYDYPLTEEQISTHYKKTKTYEDMLVLDYPNHYWHLNDTSLINNKMIATKGYEGGYYGSHNKDAEGVPTVFASKSIEFLGGGTGIVSNVNSYGNYNQMLNVNADYSVEFWFKTAQNEMGVLFSCTEELYRYGGVTIFANAEDGIETTGRIQFNETTEHSLSTPIEFNFTDNEWHHVCARRKGTTLDLVVDGSVLATKEANLIGYTERDPSQVHLMSVDPGVLNVTGLMSEVAMYSEAIQDMQINSRYHFTTRSKIFGYTLLEGNGVSAVVRFYDDITGEKVGETKSNVTGEYTFYSYTNKKLDIVALLPDNITTRYRIHAPVVPSEYDDSHFV